MLTVSEGQMQTLTDVARYDFEDEMPPHPKRLLPVMLTINEEQMQAFTAVARHSFESEMLLHLKHFLPALCQQVGDDQLRLVISSGMDRAKSRGFDNRGPVRLYLELTLMLGSQFDVDPQYPWAKKILLDDNVTPQMARADLLYGEADNYWQKVNGTGNAYFYEAIKNLDFFIRQPSAHSTTIDVSSLLGQVERVYPEKAYYLGVESLEVVINQAIYEAKQFQFATPHQVSLLVILRVILGCAYKNDPLYPWISTVMGHVSSADPIAKFQRLEQAVLKWLGELMSIIQQEGEI